jgi:hypothetical protein
MDNLLLPIRFKIRLRLEGTGFCCLPRAGCGFKKAHYKDGPILSQSKEVSAENREIGLIFLL